MDFTHVNSEGEARMVNISSKEFSNRRAVACCRIFMKETTLEQIKNDVLKKGNVLCTARVAGIAAIKRTYDLIPMCHNIPIDGAEVDLRLNFAEKCVDIEAKVECFYKTGVEMEALTGASIAALTVYDMCKAVDKEMVIGDIKLLSKTK